MNNKIVFFNIGWMDFYKAISNDTILGGGKYVEKEGWGYEMFNFQDCQGLYYGYVQPKIDNIYINPDTIKLEKLGGSKSDELVDNVTVVWTAKEPTKGGTFIVGWYLNATVFRYEQSPPEHSNRVHKNIPVGYFTKTKSNSAKLLFKDERVIFIHRRKKNWMGQSNVWYADNNPEFVKLVKDYIFKGIGLSKVQKENSVTGIARQNDPLRRIEIEKNAIKIVINHYTKLGFQVQSFEKDNVGWDLTATNSRTELKLEVKGLSGNNIATELTPNEFKNLKADIKFYRICIVTEALLKERAKLRIFAFSEDNKQWTSGDGTILKFEELISVRIFG